MDINKFDFNLLRVFDAVYRTRSVSRAAEDLGLSQPATSQALTRLRVALRDSLFVRSPTGVEPTPKAVELAWVVRDAIERLQSALLAATDFSAPQTARRFKIHLSDIGEALFLPRLVSAFAVAAPGGGIDCENTPESEIGDELDAGRLDFAIGLLPHVRGTESAVLARDGLVLVARADHPSIARGGADYKLESFDPSAGIVVVRPYRGLTEALDRLGWSKWVVMRINHFFALPLLLASSEYAALVPLRVAALLREAQPALQIVVPSRPLASLEVSLHWSKRFELDPAHRWLRELIIATVSE